MCCRGRVESNLAFYGSVDGGLRHFVFLGQGVGENRYVLAVEEIQEPIVHATLADTQFVDAVSQQVRFGTPQFVTKFSQSSNANDSLGECPPLTLPQLQQPIPSRDGSVVILEEDKLRPWHDGTRDKRIAIMRYCQLDFLAGTPPCKVANAGAWSHVPMASKGIKLMRPVPSCRPLRRGVRLGPAAERQRGVARSLVLRKAKQGHSKTGTFSILFGT